MEGDIDAEMIFSEGREVEVTSVEEGFKGAWYTATILKYPKNKTEGKKVLVQYKNLLEDDNQKPLTEHVKLSFIRPLPPQPKFAGDQCFEVNDVVDAFHLDGWWTGSVYEVLHNPKKYIVSFADPPEEIEFSSSDLRPHWEWVDGKWVKSSKFQEVLVSPDCQELVELSCNTAKDARATVQLESSDAVESSSKKHELCCVSSRKTEGLSTVSKGPARGKHVKRATPEGDATPLHPSKKVKDGSSANSLLSESHIKDTEQPKVDCGGEENVGLLKNCERMLKLHAEGTRYPAADKMDNLNVAAIEVSEVEQMTKEVEPSVPKGLPIECMSGPVTEESCHVTKEEINLQKEHGRNRYQKEGGAKTGINRRGQPHVALESKQPKLVFRISQSPSAGKNDAAGALEEMVSEEYTATEIESSAIGRLERAGSQTMSIERTLVVSATDCQKKIIKVAGKSDGILHENEQSPLICHKELQSGLKKIHSVVMEENYSDVPPGFENQWRDPRKKSLEIMVQSPLVGMNNEPEERQDLPFVKSLPIWKAVELMEIFQVMPQNPHFHPLVKLNEILREGVAVGHMLTFASLVQRTSKLTVADPRNHFTSILDALLEMETLGFDVQAVRDRTSDLLFMKDRHEHLQDHSNEVELQATQLSGELSKINKEIDANIKMVREL